MLRNCLLSSWNEVSAASALGTANHGNMAIATTAAADEPKHCDKARALVAEAISVLKTKTLVK